MTQRGMTLVYTGHGKGKTTAALGLALRAAGRGKKVLILQFIKSPSRTYGEKLMFDKIGIEMIQTGIGFTWTKTPKEHREALKESWILAKEKLLSSDYDMLVLDEINNALSIDKFPIDDVLPLDEVVASILNRPPAMHVVLTGRNARKEITDIADLVTEMQPVKHYYDEGVSAIKGIEF